jgi:hypothetical protein
MLNFYAFYNKTGLDNEAYKPLIEQLFYEDCENGLPSIEHIIKKDAVYAYIYCTTVLGRRWSEAEPYIMKKPCRAYRYARSIIKGRWVDAEPYIMKDPYYAYWYARYILKDRWIEAEPFIKKHNHLWEYYCTEFNL